MTVLIFSRQDTCSTACHKYLCCQICILLNELKSSLKSILQILAGPWKVWTLMTSSSQGALYNTSEKHVFISLTKLSDSHHLLLNVLFSQYFLGFSIQDRWNSVSYFSDYGALIAINLISPAAVANLKPGAPGKRFYTTLLMCHVSWSCVFFFQGPIGFITCSWLFWHYTHWITGSRFGQTEDFMIFFVCFFKPPNFKA